MAEQEKCIWIGASGKRYEYGVHALPVTFNPNQDGNYIYAKLNSQRQWVPVYIGEGDLADRSSDNHHQTACIKSKGATHFHEHLNANQDDRRAEEQDLLARYTNSYKPVGCNERPGG